MPEIPSHGGVICHKGRELVRLKRNDLLWGMRMIVGEGGSDAFYDREGQAIMWCMVNRFAMLFPQYKTFTAFIRAYSQPINPKFYNGGSRDRDPNHIDDRERRRESIRKMQEGDFPEVIFRGVEQILNPRTPMNYVPEYWPEIPMVRPPQDMIGLVHFFSPCFYYAKHLEKRVHRLTPAEVDYACERHYGSTSNIVFVPLEEVDERGNAFYKIQRNWKADTVGIMPGELSRKFPKRRR